MALLSNILKCWTSRLISLDATKYRICFYAIKCVIYFYVLVKYLSFMHSYTCHDWRGLTTK